MAIRRILQVVSWLALAATIVPPVLFLTERMELGQMKTWMLAATIVWFAATPLWMGRERHSTA
jgi:hypothetical protein